MGLEHLKIMVRTTQMEFFMGHIQTDALGENHSGNIHYLVS